ncbi:MAG: class I SAM-dependent methyltransferase [Anaerolineae bacterium]|nr:class I SAM-dependent methyltransferase [Anaerolineae bacterium]
MSTSDFYNQLSPFYHLIFADWEASIQRQADQLNSLIEEFLGVQAQTILDVSCGIGTQAIGLAQLGYQVVASDLSAAEIERAKAESLRRRLKIDWSVADMRQAYTHHQRQFDVVISCDNSVPHLLNDDLLLTAFRQFYACTKPGGGCLITVRDYDQVERQGLQVKPYGLRVENGVRYLMFQVWEFTGDIYDLSMYLVKDGEDNDVHTQVMRTQYYAVSPTTLIRLLTEAGFVDVVRLDGRFYQPVIIGKKADVVAKI